MTKYNLSSIGIVEITFYTNALIVLDEMMKTADVNLIHWEKKLGGRLVSIIISGDTSAVKAAIDTAISMESIVGADNIKVAIDIPSPHPQIIKLIYKEQKPDQVTEKDTKPEPNPKEKSIKPKVEIKKDPKQKSKK